MIKFRYNPPTDELKALWEKSKTDPSAAYEFCAQINNQFAHQLRGTAHKMFHKGSWWIKRKHFKWTWPFYYTTDHLAVYPAYRKWVRELNEAAQAIDTMSAVMRQMQMNIERENQFTTFPQDIEEGFLLYTRPYVVNEHGNCEYGEWAWRKVNYVGYNLADKIHVLGFENHKHAYDPGVNYVPPMFARVAALEVEGGGMEIDWEPKLDEID